MKAPLLPIDGVIPNDSNSNNSNGWYTLGMQFFRQSNIMPQSLNAAAKWLLKAAINGHHEAALMLGRIMESRGEKRFKQAFHWYRRAATLNNIEGMKRLAKAYTLGRGTSVNTDKAKYWKLKADMLEEELTDISDSYYEETA